MRYVDSFTTPNDGQHVSELTQHSSYLIGKCFAAGAARGYMAVGETMRGKRHECGCNRHATLVFEGFAGN